MPPNIQRLLSFDEKSRLYHLRTIRDLETDRVPNRLGINTLYILTLLGLIMAVISGNFLIVSLGLTFHLSLIIFDILNKYILSKKLNNAINCYNTYERLLISKYRKQAEEF